MKSIINKLTDDNKNWFFQFWHDWEFSGCNWYNFSLIEAKGEYDKCMSGVELEFALLGLHIRWRWNYAVTEQMAKLHEDVAAIRAGSACIKKVPLGTKPVLETE
jgi:hypothetical protein